MRQPSVSQHAAPSRRARGFDARADDDLVRPGGETIGGRPGHLLQLTPQEPAARAVGQSLCGPVVAMRLPELPPLFGAVGTGERRTADAVPEPSQPPLLRAVRVPDRGSVLTVQHSSGEPFGATIGVAHRRPIQPVPNSAFPPLPRSVGGHQGRSAEAMQQPAETMLDVTERVDGPDDLLARGRRESGHAESVCGTAGILAVGTGVGWYPTPAQLEHQFYYGNLDRVSFQPEVPPVRHVWVYGHGQGDARPGVVIAWQHQPIHLTTQAEWVALVAEWAYDDAFTVSWVGAERLVPIRDGTRADEAPKQRTQPLRHAWVRYGPEMWAPCLVLDWRQDSDGWRGRVASAGLRSLHVSWSLASVLRPVTDDRQRRQQR